MPRSWPLIASNLLHLMNGLLVIVSCGKAKIWDKKSATGATSAQLAYTGPLFKINRAFAEKFGEKWMILSAKFGFIEPTFQIPEPYNVTFTRKSSGPIAVDQLRRQVADHNFARFSKIIALGGKDYQRMVEAAFSETPVQPLFPFRGLDIFKLTPAIKRAIAANDPFNEEASRG